MRLTDEFVRDVRAKHNNIPAGLIFGRFCIFKNVTRQDPKIVAEPYDYKEAGPKETNVPLTTGNSY
jgi:hypothetical protein